MSRLRSSEKYVLAGIVIAAIAASGVYAAPRIFLSTQPFSQQVQFTRWNPTVSCFGNPPVTIYFLNFTVDLSGRDPGSSWIKFQSNITVVNGATLPTMYLYSVQDFSVIYQPLCHLASFPIPPYEAVLQPSTTTAYWRPFQSGVYSLFIGTQSFASTLGPQPFYAVQSWTVTTIV